MGPIQRKLVKTVLRVVAWPKLTLLIAGVVLIGCIAGAYFRLGISTDQNKLLSSDLPFFRDYLMFIERFPENEAIYVVVEAQDAQRPPAVARWTALADRITENLRGVPQVRSVDARVPLDELGAQGLLLEKPERMRFEVQGLHALAKQWGEPAPVLQRFMGDTPLERFLVGVQADATPEGATFMRGLAESWQAAVAVPEGRGVTVPDLAALGGTDPSRLGYYYVPDESDPRNNLLLVRVYPRVQFNSLTAISETVEAIRGAVQAAAKDFPDFRVGVTGRPALEADEMRQTDTDTHRAEVIALSLVFVGLVLMLRSVWLALVAELTLAVGIGWTFGWATLAVGELNLLSLVFVIALIGIGMDYLIQILARYRREARRYERQTAVWARVFRYTSPPISTACLGAAGAFFVSLLTDFSGAAELGIIAGGGLLLCLVAGYTVLPAILVLFRPKLGKVNVSRRYTHREAPPRVGGWRLMLPVVWVTLVLAGLPWMVQTGFDPNLLKLQAPGLESVQLVRKLDTWYAVVLADDLDQLARVRAAMAGAPTVDGTESLLEARENFAWLQENRQRVTQVNWQEPPAIKASDVPSLAANARKLAGLYRQRAAGAAPALAARWNAAADAVAAFADVLAGAATPEARAAMAARLTAWQAAWVASLKEAMAGVIPEKVELLKLPREVRDHFVSVDAAGKPTYAMYIYPSKDLWQQEHLEAFVREVEQRAATVPGNHVVTGIAMNLYHSTAAIERSFYKATAYAMLLIIILVWIDLRSITLTLVAISVLLLGLPMLVILMGMMGVSWNFANFFGLPILIGAGHEYGVFMVHRYKEVLHNPRRVWRRWDVSDWALLLCAFVTSTSFGFFWAIGHHEGLRSLGLVMALGAACIYAATVVVVRPLLRWRLHRKGVYDVRTAPEDEED